MVDLDGPIEAVIFDCDGVLVETEGVAAEIWVEKAHELGYPLDYETALSAFKGGEMAWCVAWLEERLGQPVPDDFVVDFRARQTARFETGVQPIPGVEGVLRGLRVPFCVASNGPREKMNVTLRVAGLMPWFESRIVSAYEVGSFKPNPGLFLAAAEVLGTPPERCVVVEDSLPGVRAAIAANMRVFSYVAASECDEYRGEGAVPFTSMDDLPALLDAS